MEVMERYQHWVKEPLHVRAKKLLVYQYCRKYRSDKLLYLCQTSRYEWYATTVLMLCDYFKIYYEWSAHFSIWLLYIYIALACFPVEPGSLHFLLVEFFILWYIKYYAFDYDVHLKCVISKKRKVGRNEKKQGRKESREGGKKRKRARRKRKRRRGRGGIKGSVVVLRIISVNNIESVLLYQYYICKGINESCIVVITMHLLWPLEFISKFLTKKK